MGEAREYDFFNDRNPNNEILPTSNRKKWIRVKDAVDLYSLSRSKLMRVATDAGAIYKIEATVLIDSVTLESYIETFKVPGGVL